MKLLNSILFLGTVLFLITCQHANEIALYKDLSKASREGAIQVVTIDTSVYYLNKFTFDDSSLTGTGTREKAQIKSDFDGRLLFKDISYIQSRDHNLLKSLAFLGVTTFIVIKGSPAITDESGLEAVVEIIYPSRGGGGSSCPFIYSWNGEKYVLEGEAFGTALGKALEYETCTMLPALISEKSKLKIKLTNERPETHFFNNVKLIACETDINSVVYVDNNNFLWPVKEQVKPLSALDQNDSDITDLIIEEDNVYWQSDLTSAKVESGFEDQIVVNFPKNKNIDSVSLIISAINTTISSVVFKKLQSLLGDEFVNFVKATENDPEMIEILKETLTRSSLKVDVWDGNNWIYQDMIYPEANQIKFQKLLRLSTDINSSDILKIRLRCMTDLWKLDAVLMDDSPASRLITYEVILTSAQFNNKNVIDKIEKTDSSYVIIIPGEEINLEFEEIRKSDQKKISYALLAEGYLYELVIDKSNILESEPLVINTNTQKLEFVKTLLRNFDLFLPMIYAEWELLRDAKDFTSRDLK